MFLLEFESYIYRMWLAALVADYVHVVFGHRPSLRLRRTIGYEHDQHTRSGRFYRV